jgi:hypothetical protein
MRYVRIKPGIAGFLMGDRYLTRDDGPFAVESDQRARDLISAGLVEGCVPLPAIAAGDVMQALHPGPAKAERAVARPAGRNSAR